MKFCSFEGGCDKEARKGGVCMRHGANRMQHVLAKICRVLLHAQQITVGRIRNPTAES